MNNRINGGLEKTQLHLSTRQNDLAWRLRSFAARPANPTQPAARPLFKLALNLQETAWVMSLSTRTIRRLVSRGLLHPSKASRRWIFSRAEIEKFLTETTTN